MDSSVSLKDEIWFLRVCHRIYNAVYRRVFRSIWVCVIMYHGTGLCDKERLQMLFEMLSSLKSQMLFITQQRMVMSFKADTYVVCSHTD